VSRQRDIDEVLREWPFEPGAVSARTVRADGGRTVIQMRVELGVLQMETEGRPDGERPGGAETYLDYLNSQLIHRPAAFQLSEEQCAEVDREFLQFYQRRICWMALRQFDRAVADADHTLALMDFLRHRSPDEAWFLSHEQYRPFVLFHRTQAAALRELDSAGPEAAVEEINRGLKRIRAVFQAVDEVEGFDDDEMVGQLLQLQQWFRDRYRVHRTLSEKLADAIAAEEYELAAQLRDEIARRKSRRPSGP
jgi:hypothetical protein